MYLLGRKNDGSLRLTSRLLPGERPCCIDKWSAESSEDINSMFQNYQVAAACHAYLIDVSAAGSWKASFRKSRWFTRGWTLQELIAPSSVEFFSKEGVRLGDKRSLDFDIQQ